MLVNFYCLANNAKICYDYYAEDVRIRSLRGETDTRYTYNTNAKLSQLLVKVTNGFATKYVYGHGLIGEEKQGEFKTYHFDYRGSTVAITNALGQITDTFAYDTYGKLISRTGDSFVIFGYNGRDGVVTDKNGLIYMRARYYSPEHRRFINADIIAGEISNAVTLNRYAYANGNPVSNVDPFGLAVEERGGAHSSTNFYQAVLVARFDSAGLPVVGHTQLYFLGDDGVWYYTEFTTSGGNDLKEMKGNAQIYWGTKTPPVYNSETNTFHDVKGSNYVVLNGNFNESVALAKQYYQDQNFGKYNFVFHNCSDYTDAILDVADVDGYFLQGFIDGDSPISVPSIREGEASFWSGVDRNFEIIDNIAKDIGDYIFETAKDFWNGLKSWF